MKQYLKSISLLSLLVLLSCSNREQDDMIIDENTKRDTVIVDNNDKKDTIIIANDFIVLDKDESIHFNIEKVDYWMRQPRGNRGKQGGDAYNGYLCQFEGGHSLLDIIDIKNKQLITTIQPEYNENYPCNNADFSNTLYDSQDEFPLLYSSQYGKYARCIVVDRIFKQGENYKIETVQRIDLPCEKEKPLQYSPDAILDKKNGFIYVYAGKTSPITDFYIYQFRLPKIEDGKVIKLKENDIVSRWVILNDPAYYKQGGIFINGLLITMEGKSDNKMRIIDLENHRYKLIDLKSDFGAKWEPEDIFEVDGEIFIASGGTGIYKIVFSNE